MQSEYISVNVKAGPTSQVAVYPGLPMLSRMNEKPFLRDIRGIYDLDRQKEDFIILK